MEELVCLLGLPADAAQITSCVASLSGKEAESNAQVKSYPGIEYHNYRKLGLSLQCKSCSHQFAISQNV